MYYDPSRTCRRQFKLSEFQLENGNKVPDFILSYIVHGAEPQRNGSNVILVTSSLGGDAHRLDFAIGETLALSPEKYCIICIDAIGNGHSSSPSNHVSLPCQNFPEFSILDMVRSQQRLLNDVFSLNNILAVAGASMGGMQALQWAVSYPYMMQAIIAIVPMAKTPPWTQLIHETARKAIMADSAWLEGKYSSRDFEGWKTALAFNTGPCGAKPAIHRIRDKRYRADPLAKCVN